MTIVEPRQLLEMFEGLVQSAPLGMAVFDTELRYLEINARLAALNGLPREAHLGQRITELFGPSPSLDRLVGWLQEVLRTGQPITGKEILYQEPGAPERNGLYLANYYPLRRAGETVGVLTFVEDITERRRVERERDELLAREREARERAEAAALALGESELRLKAILAALDEGIVVHGGSGQIDSANVSAERILGLSVDQMTGRTSMDPRWNAIHEDGSPFPGDEHPAMVALRTGEPVKNVPMGVNRPDGSRVWLSVSALPLCRSPGASPYMVVASFFDVTEYKLALEASRRSEEERTRLLREAQEAVRVRDEFLTVASHELRTPLTSLRLHLQMLVRQLDRANTELAAQLAPRCESMERQISRLTGLVTALLDVSRLAVGRLTLEVREVDLAQLVWQVADAFAGEFQRAGALLHIRGAQQPLVGRWDSLRLEQVLVNLLSNAVRYGLGNPVEVAIRREGDQALLMVKDRGIGISEADLARIFGKFERAVSERNYGGLGLGLYITRQIVEAMGGSVEVRSKPGEGSVFLVRLPLNCPEAP